MTVAAIGQSCSSLYTGITINSSGIVGGLPSKMVPDTYQLVTTLASTFSTCQLYNGSSYCGTLQCSIVPGNLTVGGYGGNTATGTVACSGNLSSGGLRHFFSVPSNFGTDSQGAGTGDGTAMPALNFIDLLALGLVSTVALLWYLCRQRSHGAVEGILH